MEGKYIWVTWQGNGKSSYNGKTHKVPMDTLVNPASDLKPGDSVSVYWETGKRKYWDAVVASTKEPPATTAKRSKISQAPPPPKKLKSSDGCKFLSSSTPSKQVAVTKDVGTSVTEEVAAAKTVATQTSCCCRFFAYLDIFVIHYFQYINILCAIF